MHSDYADADDLAREKRLETIRAEQEAWDAYKRDPASDEGLAYLEDCLAKATKGPWHYSDYAGKGRYRVIGIMDLAVLEPRVEPCVPPLEKDCQLICSARDALPALIKEVRRLRGLLRGLSPERAETASDRPRSLGRAD